MSTGDSDDSDDESDFESEEVFYSDSEYKKTRQTLSGHTSWARRRRPVEQRVDCSSTPRGAQVKCVVALSNGRVVSGSFDNTLKVWDDVEGMMARLVALRRTPGNFDKRLIGRLIARFL